MEKRKVLVSFVEKVQPQLKNGASTPCLTSGLFALMADGKRLVRLQPADRVKCQLIGVLTEKNEAEASSEDDTRRQVRIEPKGKIGDLELLQDENTVVVKTIFGGGGASDSKQKIPRPANAFMLFANEWRKKLAVENPRESNKDISVRLGVLWKTMSKDVKEKYFSLARKVDAEHKLKYPGSC